MHNSEFALHLSLHLKALVFFTHGAQNTFFVSTVSIQLYIYIYTYIYIFIFIYTYIYVQYNWPPALGGLYVYAPNTPPHHPDADQQCCNVVNCTYLYFSDLSFRFVFSRLVFSGLHFQFSFLRILFSRLISPDWYVSDLYFPNCILRCIFTDWYFPIYILRLYFPMCTVQFTFSILFLFSCFEFSELIFLSGRYFPICISPMCIFQIYISDLYHLNCILTMRIYRLFSDLQFPNYISDLYFVYSYSPNPSCVSKFVFFSVFSCFLCVTSDLFFPN